MGRFDSPELLAAWRDRGEWPAIHVPVVNMAVEMMIGMRLIDLGCSYGLLGARLAGVLGLEAVLGLDADEAVLAAAIEAKVPIHHQLLRVTKDTLTDLIWAVSDFRADCMVCRRILPELFGDDLELGDLFGAKMARAGVKEMIVQGRVDSGRATNKLHNVEAEVAMLRRCWEPIRQQGSVVYLRAR